MGAGTVVSTGPSRAFQRIWAALAVWNPVPVTPTSWPALALMVERFTTGPETHAKAAAAMTTPAAAEPTLANAHLRTDFILPPGLSVALVPGGHGENVASIDRAGGSPNTPTRLVAHATPSVPDLNRCISHLPAPKSYFPRSGTMRCWSTQSASRCGF